MYNASLGNSWNEVRSGQEACETSTTSKEDAGGNYPLLTREDSDKNNNMGL